LAAQRADVAKAHAIFPEAKGEWAEDFKDNFSGILNDLSPQFDQDFSDEVWWEVAEYFLEERGVDVEGNRDVGPFDPEWKEARRQAQEGEALTPEVAEGVAKSMVQMLQQYDRLWVLDKPDDELSADIVEFLGYAPEEADMVVSFINV